MKEVGKYNTPVESCADEEYGRAAEALVHPVSEGLFYAFSTKIRNPGIWGGIETDEALAVCGTDAGVIPGLCCAGHDAPGWLGIS